MCSSLVASYCGASNDKIFEATVLGVITMGIAGEIAYENSNNEGLGTFHKELFNAIPIVITPKTVASNILSFEAPL